MTQAEQNEHAFKSLEGLEKLVSVSKTSNPDTPMV
jgi:hypothetical protein